MLILVKLIIAVGIPTIFGWFILNCLNINKYLPKTVTASLGYLIGVGGISYILFLLSSFGFKLNIFNISLTLGITLMTLKLFAYLPKPNINEVALEGLKKSDANPTSSNTFAKLIFAGLCLYLFLLLVTILYQGLAIPIHKWDSIFIHAMKAKYIYYDQTLRQIINLPWPSYPLMVPLSEAWIAIIIGEWSDEWVKIIFPVGCFSLLIILYHYMRLYIQRKWALVGINLLLLAPFFVRHAVISYSDFYMMTYNCSAIIMILLWNRSGKKGLLYTSSLLSGLGIFTKTEGLCYFAVQLALVIALTCQKEKRGQIKAIVSKAFSFALIPITIYGLYSAYKLSAGIPFDSRTSYNFSLIAIFRILPTFAQITHSLASLQHWSIIWFLFIPQLLLYKKFPKHIKLLLGIILMYFGSLMALSIFTNHFTFVGGRYSITALPRLILHFYPLSVLFVTFATYYISDSYNIPKRARPN